MYDILSLSLYQSSAGIAASILLRALMPFYFLDNYSVLFVRWFWAPFCEQVVFALGVLVVPSVSDPYHVGKRHFRLFDEVLKAIELAVPCSDCHTGKLCRIRYLSFFNEIFHDVCATLSCCLMCRFFFRISRRFHFVDKKSKTVEVSSESSSFTRLCFITRAIVREAVL